MTADKLNILIGFLKVCAFSGFLIYLGYLYEKLEDAWHDRHFHHRHRK